MERLQVRALVGTMSYCTLKGKGSLGSLFSSCSTLPTKAGVGGPKKNKKIHLSCKI